MIVVTQTEETGVDRFQSTPPGAGMLGRSAPQGGSFICPSRSWKRGASRGRVSKANCPSRAQTYYEPQVQRLGQATQTLHQSSPELRNAQLSL